MKKSKLFKWIIDQYLKGKPVQALPYKGRTWIKFSENCVFSIADEEFPFNELPFEPYSPIQHVADFAEKATIETEFKGIVPLHNSWFYDFGNLIKKRYMDYLTPDYVSKVLPNAPINVFFNAKGEPEAIIGGLKHDKNSV